MADSVKIKIDGDAEGFKNALSGLGGMAEKAMSGIVTAVAAVTAALAAGMAAAINYGAAFETSMAKASTLYGTTAVDTDALSQKMLALSSSTGQAADTLGNALYNALSAGVPATEDMGEALGILESSSKLAVAGFTDIDTALSATVKTLNAYGFEMDQADRIQKILIQTQNLGITTVGELGSVLAQVTPTAAAMSVSFEQVGAALAVMTAKGIPTAQATTSLNAAFAELGKSGTVASDNLALAAEGTRYAGKSFKELSESGIPLTTILGLMGDYADDNGLSMLDMFSSIEAGKAALSIAGDAEGFNSALAAMSTEADVVGDAFAKMTDTFDFKMDQLTESAKNLGILVFNEVKDSLKGTLDEVIGWVGELSTAFNEGGFEGLVDKLGDVLGEAVGMIAEALPGIVDMGISLVSSLIENISANAPMLVEVGSKLLSSLFEGIIGILGQLGDLGTQIVPVIIDGIIRYKGLVLTVGIEIISALIAGFVNGLPQLAQSVGEVVKGLASAIVSGLQNISKAFSGNIDFTSIFGSVIEAFTEGLTEVATGIQENLPAITQGITNLIVGAVTALAENGPALITAAISVVNSVVTSLAKALPTMIPQIVAAVVQLVQSLVTVLIDNLPVIIDAGLQLLLGINEAINQSIPIIAEALPTLIVGIVNGLLANIPTIIEAGITLLNSLVEALPVVLEALVSALPTLITGLISALLSNLPLIIQAGIDLLMGLIQAIPKFILAFVKALPELIEGIITALLDPENLKLINEAGVTLFVALVENLPKIQMEIAKALYELVVGMVQNIKDRIPEMAQAGLELLQGLWQGIKDADGWIVEQIKGLGKLIVDGFKDAFNIQSPSKVMRYQIGQMLGKGIAEGIKDSTVDVVDAAKDQMDKLNKAYELPERFFSVNGSVNYDGIRANMDAVTSGQAVNVTQVFNFNEPVDSPDTVARAVNRVMTFGLAGAY